MIMLSLTSLFLFASCASNTENQSEQDKLVGVQRACAEYLRAYAEEENLDPFGEDAVNKLDIPELTSASRNLNSLLNQIDNDYPGLSSEDPSSSDYVSRVNEKYGPEALIAMREFFKMFTDVDNLVRDSCDGLQTIDSRPSP